MRFPIIDDINIDREFPYIEAWEIPYFVYWFICLVGIVFGISYLIARLILG